MRTSVEDVPLENSDETPLLNPPKKLCCSLRFLVFTIFLSVIVIVLSVVLFIFLHTSSSSSSYTLQANTMVPMRDGVLLATDIYFPKGNGPFPVILYRTPYNKSAPSANERTTAQPTTDVYPTDLANFFVPHGYVVIFQDCRGRYLSEGLFVKYLSDGNDGYDTIDWIVNQTWSNGKVAMHGMSYPAHNAMAALCTAHPSLQTAIIDMGGFSNSYQSGTRQGGTLELKQVTWAWNAAEDSPEVVNNETLKEILSQINIFDWFNATMMPWKRGENPLSYTPDYEDYLLAQWQTANFTDYWKQLGIYAEGYYDKILDHPLIFMSGWYDVYARTTIENYLGLNTQSGRVGPIRLVLGPWMHGSRSRTYVGDVDFGVNATLDNNLAIDYKNYRLEWFDFVLKGIPNRMKDAAKVKIFIMGGGSGRKQNGMLDHGGYWRDELDWPLERTVYTPYYFTPNRTLSTVSH